MQCRLAVTFFFLWWATIPVAAQGQSKRSEPERLIDQYMNMINEGDLLTPEGWQRAALLFELPGSPPSDDVIQVTTSHYPRSHIPATGDRIRVEENFVDPLGSIDSSLRYKPPSEIYAHVEGTVFVYYFVRTNKHWEPAPDGSTPQITIGAPQWKIEGSLNVRMAAVDAAIRYVARMRDETTDPDVKKNADRTIAILKRPRHRTQI